MLQQLAGHLDRVRRDIAEVLGLGDEALLRAVGGRRQGELDRRLRELEPQQLRVQAEGAGVELICRCDPAYPVRLWDLAGPPAVLHVAGGMDRFLAAAGGEAVAIVGSRVASAYGISVARSLARGLASAGVPVISGMAAGVDSSAHRGALKGSQGAACARSMAAPPPSHDRPPAGEARPQAAGPTVAVLPGPVDRPYPSGASALYGQIVRVGSVVSEMPLGAPVRSWMFLARNRMIAALAVMTIVVEAGARSGALLTAGQARAAGRPVGAVPGRITSPQATGPNQLIKDGAYLVAGAQEVLDLLFEAGTRIVPGDDRPELSRELRALLAAIEEGHDTTGALIRHGIVADQGLAALASLELAGYVSRGPGGRFTVLP